MQALETLSHSLVLFVSTLTGSVKIALTLLRERVVLSGADFYFVVFLFIFLAIVAIIFLAIILRKTYSRLRHALVLVKGGLRQSFDGGRKKIAQYFSVKKNKSKAPPNFELASKAQKILALKKQRKAAGHIFIATTYPALASLAFVLFALLAYNLPERYQLANLINSVVGARFIAPENVTDANQVGGYQDAMNPGLTRQGLMNQTPTEVLGETIKAKNPNLYALLNPNATQKETIQLGGLLLTKQNELFVASGSLVSDSLRRHSLKNINLADNAITSRTIENGTIRSADLASQLTLKKLTLDKLLIGTDAPSHFTLAKGDAHLSSRLEVDGAVYFDQTLSIAHNLEVAGLISGDISGNAGTVSSGLYANQVYANPAWLTAVPYTILSGTTPTWNQNTTGNAATVTGLSVTVGQTLTVTSGGTLGSAAYTNTAAYATATQGTTADNALPKAGGTMTGGITNSTSLNPLTTLAESWIGPSSTTGIYFKGGFVGIGTTTPGTTLSVLGHGLIGDASWASGTIAAGTDLAIQGNVGIGTTNPSALFSVGATSQFQVSSAGALTAVGINSGAGLIQGTGGLTITGTISLPDNAITNLNLANSTISGVALGSNLATLTFGTHLSGTSYNGSAGVTIATDATDANTASTIVARDVLGNFSAGTITAALTGNAATVTGLSVTAGQTLTVTTGGTIASAAYTLASAYATSTQGVTADNALPKAGGTMTGDIALTTHSITLTGSIGDNINRVTKLWTTNLESTNLPTISGGTLANALGLGSAAYTSSAAYDAAGAAAAITPATLGLVIGTNVEAYNANLAGINQALTTTSSPSFSAVGATTFTGALTGHASSDALSDQTFYIGTTNLAINRASATLVLTGITSIDGLSATATKLATARAINGVDFDGTAPITVTADANTLSGTTLNPTVIASSLTSVGTLTNLTVTNTITGAVSGNAGTVTGLSVTAGQILTVTSGGTLGSAAYTLAAAYATSTQGTTADNALPKAGGTMTGGITNSTSLNPLTTLAEAWIGPSSTTGIYFKAGSVGIGTTSPAALFSIGTTSQFQVSSAGNVTAGTYNGVTITSGGNGTLTLNNNTLTLSGSAQLNQDLLTTSNPIFADVTLTGLTGSIISSTSIKTSLEELDESLAKEGFTGFDAWNGGSNANSYTITEGKFQLDRSGSGFIKGKKVTWTVAGTDHQTGVLAANTTSWIYIDTSGNIGFTATPTGATFTNYIVLFEVLYDGTNYDVVRENHPYAFNSAVSSYLHNNAGTIIRGNGAIATRVTTGTGTSNSDREIKIIGTDYIDDHGLTDTISDSGGNGVTWQVYYTNSGHWFRDVSQTQLPMKYNDSGTTTTLTTGGAKDFNVYTLYVSKNDLETTTPLYIAVMGDGYATANDAQAAINAGTVNFAGNELSGLEMAQLGYVIVENNGSGGYANSVTVAKSTFNQQLVGGSAGSDHGTLTGLTDDDHLQYALLAGRINGQTLIGGTVSTDDLILQTTSGSGAPGADMIFQTGDNGGTEALRILYDGKVGIGTTNPSEKFQIGSSFKINSFGTITGAGGNISMWTNDSNYLTSYTETDPNVSAWARNATKPTYTASEVGLGNVTNESKATMFSSPTFTGTVSGITATMVGLGNVPNLSFSGSNTGDDAVNTLYSGLVTNATHTGDATGSAALTVVRINGTSMAGLATGILKNTTGTGVPSIAVAGDFPTLNQNTTGSAATLTTARNINGVSFNGSADIIITAAAGTLTGTTLASGVTGSSLTSVGTLGSLAVTGAITWSGGGSANANTAYSHSQDVTGGVHGAVSTNTANMLVRRDGSGNFSAGTITGALTGAASSNVLKTGDTMTGNLIMSSGKIVPGNASGDGRTSGVWMWTNTDSNWAIYMAQPATGINPAGTTMTAGHFGNTHSIRIRSGSGFSVERYSDNTVTMDSDSSGNFWTLGAITNGGTINGQTISSAANFTGTVAVGSTLSLPQNTWITGGSSYSLMRDSYLGYSSSYRTVQIGSGSSSVSIGVDLTGNASGAFSGNGGEVFFKNGMSFVTPNATNNGYITPMSFGSTGVVNFANGVTGVTYNGQTISSAASFTGTVTAAGAINSTVTGIQTAGTTRIDTSGSIVNVGTISANGYTFLESLPSTGDIYANIRVLRSKAIQADGMYINYGGTGGTAKIYDGGTTYAVSVGSGGTLSVPSTITSGLINGQTISSAANFTGTINAASTITAPTFSGALSGNATTATNASQLNGLASTTFQQRVSYSTTASNSGYYKINIIPATSWMLSFTIRLYQSYGYDDIRISGYNYGANYWYAPLADLLNSSATSIDVRFGYDSAYNLWVAVPAAAYTGLEIFDITNGYSQVNQNWSSNFTIVNQTSLTGTVQATQTVYRPLKYNENAATATTAGGVTSHNNRTDNAWYQAVWQSAGDTNVYSTAAVSILSSGYGAIAFNANSWQIQGNATYGLNSNTGFNAAAGLWDAGNRVYSAGNPQVNISGNAATATTATNLASGGNFNGSVACINGSCPTNSAIRMTPNFHFNTPVGYAMIVNWDNGATGGTVQQFRVGNGSGTDAFYVLANGGVFAGGNVGIGTTGPADTAAYGGKVLDVAGPGYFRDSADATKYLSVGTSAGTSYIQANGTSNSFNFYTAGTSKMVIATGGNVGIGTTSPGAKLESYFASGGLPLASGTAQTYGALRLREGNGVLDFGTHSNGNGWIQNADATNLAVNYNLLLQPNGGRVGIGTTAPASTLSVGPFAGIADAAISGYKTGTSSIGVYGQAEYGVYGTSNATNGIGIYGGASIGSTKGVMASGTAYDFYANGAGVDYGTSSSIRWKSNIKNITGALDAVMNLKGVTYDMNQEHGGGHQIGFIGEEIGKYFPEIVSFDPDSSDPSYYVTGMDYSKMTPVLLSAIQEQQGEISGQENQISTITQNQNKIVEQLTGQLADQDLTVDNKLQLIGQNLDSIQTQLVASLQEQITAQKSDILALQKQMADIQTNMYIERYDALWNFYQNFELGKMPLKNALENVFEGKITASEIEALHTITATDIKATNNLEGQKLKLGTQTSGTSAITAGELESEKILTTEAIGNMKIYITPMSNTFDQVLYVNEITAGESFRVKINKEVTQDIKFNWLIVK